MGWRLPHHSYESTSRGLSLLRARPELGPGSCPAGFWAVDWRSGSIALAPSPLVSSALDVARGRWALSVSRQCSDFTLPSVFLGLSMCCDLLDLVAASARFATITPRFTAAAAREFGEASYSIYLTHTHGQAILGYSLSLRASHPRPCGFAEVSSAGPSQPSSMAGGTAFSSTRAPGRQTATGCARHRRSTRSASALLLNGDLALDHK